MLEFYQKRTWRTILHSPVAFVIAVLLCLAMANVVYGRYTIEREMIGKRLEAEKKLEVLINRKAELERKVEYLSNDRGIEAEMRRNFDVARPGEQVVIILDTEPDAVIQPLDKMEGDEAYPWYQFWR